MINRRDFVRSSSMTALAVAAFGTIHCKDSGYTTTDPTTTDILGPFYRPNAPLRNNLVPSGSTGEPLRLTGTIFGPDGKTAQSGVKVEAWQCDENELYDNTSDDYLFRGTTSTDQNGQYYFDTIVPVPYKVAANSWRPAHIHLLVSSPDHQDLITQVYFSGDIHLKNDSSSNSPTAAKRILNIKAVDGKKTVNFDIVMSKHIPLDTAVYSKICGLYQMDRGMAEFYQQDDLLMMKRNGQISEGMAYAGENTFRGAMDRLKVKFEMGQDGSVKSKIYQVNFNNPDRVTTIEGTKILKY